MEKTGVYIGENAELVRTGLYEIIFRRDPSQSGFYLEAGLSKIHQNGKELLALCRMDKAAQSIRYAFKHDSVSVNLLFL